MLFVSQQFLEIFLPLCFVAFYGLYYIRPALGVAAMLAASLIFCANNGASQTVVLAASIIMNFCVGVGLTRISPHKNRQRRALLILGVGCNLLLLGYFKYSSFIVTNIDAAFGANIPVPSVTLPIGISFYTFTQIAFIADVFAGRGPSRLSFMNYSLFVTYFPHVVAGPIIHWREMMPQFENIRSGARGLLESPEHRERVCRGLCLFGIGLSKKVLIADQLAPFVAKGFEAPASIGFVDAWLTSLSYTFQLYYDFSGYSDMAVGMSLVFGVMLPFNFESPYQAVSIQDFWRRWHITLSRWLRDYLFIPLGGNRGGSIATLRNLFVTFLLGGIWHGAAWTFIVWGALHGLACCIHRLWAQTSLHMPKALALALTFLFVNAAWVFFRAPDTVAALHMLTAMTAPGRGAHGFPNELSALLAIAAFLVWTAPTSQRLALETRIGIHPIAASLSGAALLIAIVAQNSSAPSPFLYFNF